MTPDKSLNKKPTFLFLGARASKAKMMMAVVVCVLFSFHSHCLLLMAQISSTLNDDSFIIMALLKKGHKPYSPEIV